MIKDREEEVLVKPKSTLLMCFWRPPVSSHKPHNFLETLVTRLSTSLHTPENEIIKQGFPNDSLYILSEGDCAVNIRDQHQEDHIAYKLLVEGDHFGEISMVYGCNA
jgi:CRP-like cAMP-binding protein